MALEIERKFLINKEKWAQLNKPEGDYFRQGYILNEKKCTIRIRVTGQFAYITLKGSTEGISRKEFEYKIPFNDGIEILESFATTSIEKTRYKVMFGGKLWEVDEFSGENSGLLMAEIELKDENEEFLIPDWIQNEVSDDPRYYNSNLSVFPYKQWGQQ